MIESVGYKNYLEVRDAVWRMIKNRPKESSPSKYWQEEIAGFDYMFDASPLIIQKLRQQTYHLTGLHDYEYRSHHARNSRKIEERLRSLKSQDKNNLLVPESPELGGFGYNIGGKLYNVDTLKFYESFIALDKVGALEQFRESPTSSESRSRTSGKIVLEIGSGWGGLAYQWKTLFPKTSYILVDFPETILFSATYLKTLFPVAKIFISDGKRESLENLKAADYDFIFIPNYAWDLMGKNLIPDLILNQASFQEMTTEQVDKYIRKANDWGVKNIYSWNRDHSPNNPELSTVSEVLRKYYIIKEIIILDNKKLLGYKGILKRFLYKRRQAKLRDYRHLVGYL